jgi:hypothetical protein
MLRGDSMLEAAGIREKLEVGPRRQEIDPERVRELLANPPRLPRSSGAEEEEALVLGWPQESGVHESIL